MGPRRWQVRGLEAINGYWPKIEEMIAGSFEGFFMAGARARLCR